MKLTDLFRKFQQQCIDRFHELRTLTTKVWKLRKFALTVLKQIFRESNVFTKEIMKS